MGLAKNIKGEEFQVPSVIGNYEDQPISLSGLTEQKITTCNSLRKGSKWAGIANWSTLATIHIGDNPEWIITKTEMLPNKHKKVHFKPIIHEKEEKEIHEDNEEFKKLVKELELTDDNLKNLIEDMLVKVFIQKTLKKLLKSDYIEFILDEEWFYLRMGDTAYRV